jgi:predicted nucleic acid-binding protein
VAGASAVQPVISAARPQFALQLDATLQIVAQHLIYADDAYFLVCARNQSCALLTLDGGLRTVARTAHISLVEVKP